MIELLILIALVRYRDLFLDYDDDEWVRRSLEDGAGIDSDYEYLKRVK